MGQLGLEWGARERALRIAILLRASPASPASHCSASPSPPVQSVKTDGVSEEHRLQPLARLRSTSGVAVVLSSLDDGAEEERVQVLVQICEIEDVVELVVELCLSLRSSLERMQLLRSCTNIQQC